MSNLKNLNIMNAKQFTEKKIKQLTEGSLTSQGKVKVTEFGPCVIVHIEIVSLYDDRVEVVEANYSFYEDEMVAEEVVVNAIGVQE